MRVGYAVHAVFHCISDGFFLNSMHALVCPGIKCRGDLSCMSSQCTWCGLMLCFACMIKLLLAQRDIKPLSVCLCRTMASATQKHMPTEGKPAGLHQV